MIKLKCSKAIQIGDGKQKQPFVKGGVYDALSIAGIRDELFVIGDRAKRDGGNWQAISAYPSGYVVLGVASFDVVEE